MNLESRFMTSNDAGLRRWGKIWRITGLAIAVFAISLSGGSVFSRETSPAVELARQLNQAFIEVADQVSPSVVVIRVAHKANFSDSDIEEDNPFWDLIPRQFRKQLEEQQREKQRREKREQ